MSIRRVSASGDHLRPLEPRRLPSFDLMGPDIVMSRESFMDAAVETINEEGAR